MSPDCPKIAEWGWSYVNDTELVFRWDSDSNFNELRNIESYGPVGVSVCQQQGHVRIIYVVAKKQINRVARPVHVQSCVTINPLTHL